MAISRGSGTEIIRTAMFEAVTGSTTTHDLIIGEQHHIYTVLSVIVKCAGLASSSDYIEILLLGYDSFGGTSAQPIILVKEFIVENKTFVWNDKFSFNGCEPTNFTGPLSTVAEQNLIADQAESGTPQKLRFYTQGGSSSYDLTVTFIDQNNS